MIQMKYQALFIFLGKKQKFKMLSAANYGWHCLRYKALNAFLCNEDWLCWIF